MAENEPTTTQAAPTGADPGPSHLDALMGDRVASEPTSPEPTAPKSAEPAPAAPTPAPAPEPTSAAPAAPPPTFKYRGQEYTVEELAKSGRLADALTSAEQLPHLQKKYMEMLEQTRQAQQQAQQPPVQTPQQTPAQYRAALRAQYDPQMQALVEQGLIERDAVELYPDFIAQGFYLRDMTFHAVRKIGELERVIQGLTGRTQAEDARGMKGKIDQTLDGLASQDEIYKPLSDPDTREKFWTFLSDLDPYTDRLTGDKSAEFLGRMWVAFNQEAIVAAAKAQAEQRKAEEARTRANVAGGGSGARPAPAAPGAPTHMDRLLEGVLPRR